MSPEARTDWAALHSTWTAMGLDPGRFWALTMREIDRELEATVKRLDRERDERIHMAWHMVALDRTKKLPKLETLLSSGRRPAKLQTPAEHEFAMKAIFLAFGGDPDDLRTLQ